MWNNGIYKTGQDARGAFIRARMKEYYPNLEDELAVLSYGSGEEKALHAERRRIIKEEADTRFPKGALEG